VNPEKETRAKAIIKIRRTCILRGEKKRCPAGELCNLRREKQGNVGLQSFVAECRKITDEIKCGSLLSGYKGNRQPARDLGREDNKKRKRVK